MEAEEQLPQSNRSRAMVNKRARPAEPEPVAEEPAPKKLKVDHEQQVQ